MIIGLWRGVLPYALHPACGRRYDGLGRARVKRNRILEGEEEGEEYSGEADDDSGVISPCEPPVRKAPFHGCPGIVLVNEPEADVHQYPPRLLMGPYRVLSDKEALGRRERLREFPLHEERLVPLVCAYYEVKYEQERYGEEQRRREEFEQVEDFDKEDEPAALLHILVKVAALREYGPDDKGDGEEA